MKNSKFYLGLIAVVAIVFIARYFYYKPNVTGGEEAPDFSFSTLKGEEKSLSDFRGSYVLLDFWGSWCAPCRQENPNLKRVYNEFSKNPKFELISIGIETNESSWMKAISVDALLWDNHYTDTKRFQSTIAKAYGVRSIPTKFLINPQGQIVLVNPSFVELEAYLSEKLG